MVEPQAFFASLESKLWIACIFCEIALCIALIKRRLLDRYSFLFGLAFVNALRDVGLAAISDPTSETYSRLWALTLPILMFIQVAAVWESYRNLTTQYPRLGAFASQLLVASLALLVVASCVSAAWTFHQLLDSLLQAILFTYRYLAFVLAGCLALPCLVLSRFPKPDKLPARNVQIHLWMLVAYFCVYALSFFSVNILGVQERAVTVINVFMMLAICCLYSSWAFVLTPKGETSVQWPELENSLLALIDKRSDAAVERGKRLRGTATAEPLTSWRSKFQSNIKRGE